MNDCRNIKAAALLAAAALASVSGMAAASDPDSRLAIAYETLSCSSYSDAMPQLVRAADAGSAEAQEIVGRLYLTGEYGIERDETRAMRYLRHAAEAGRADAQRLVTAFELGLHKEQFEGGLRADQAAMR